METSGIEPGNLIRKINVLPTKLYPLKTIQFLLNNIYIKLVNNIFNYPRNDSNVHGYKPTKLKFALSTIPALGLNIINIYSVIFIEYYADIGLAPLSFGHQ